MITVYLTSATIYKYTIQCHAVLYDNSNAQAVLFDQCSTLNPAFSDMTDADKMIFIFQSNDSYVSKHLGYYISYALNI